MKNILARGNRILLEQFAWSNGLLALDYDGTLAPIVADPRQATMRRTTSRLLAMAARLYPVVVISGRARADALARLGDVGIREVVGNHGIEWREGRAALAPRIDRWLKVLTPRLSQWQGVEVESKRYSVAVHYRRARAKRAALLAILEAAATLADTRVVGGKLVVNLLPREAGHKGSALVRERQRLGCDTALYVGDDETDEDVFRLDEPGRLLGVRVGRSRATAASYCVRGQAQVDDLLSLLLLLRR